MSESNRKNIFTSKANALDFFQKRVKKSKILYLLTPPPGQEIRNFGFLTLKS